MSYTSTFKDNVFPFDNKVFQFDTIADLTIQECIAIYKNDGWFTGEDKGGGRYVQLVPDKTNLTVKVVREETEGFTEVTKAKYVELVGNEIDEQQLINLAFSVNGNKGPFLTFKLGKSNVDKSDRFAWEDETKLKYLAHHAWVLNSASKDDETPVTQNWIYDDPVFKAVYHKLTPTPTKDILKQMGDFGKFDTPYYTKYKELVETTKDDEIKKLLALDLNRSQTYLETLSREHVGGSRKKSRKKSKKSKGNLKKHTRGSRKKSYKKKSKGKKK